jgi:hypothetical protein
VGHAARGEGDHAGALDHGDLAVRLLSAQEHVGPDLLVDMLDLLGIGWRAGSSFEVR